MDDLGWKNLTVENKPSEIDSGSGDVSGNFLICIMLFKDNCLSMRQIIKNRSTETGALNLDDRCLSAKRIEKDIFTCSNEIQQFECCPAFK